MKKQSKNLLLVFLLIFGIKSLISLYYNGTYFYSDEACVIAKAKYFAKFFEIVTCQTAIHAPAGDPLPLYSIVLSPIYLFTKGMTAYTASLIFNSFLISSLVYPLYAIISNFLKKEKFKILIIIAILFLPQIAVYEKTLLTETLFVATNIWMLHFYMKFLSKRKKKLNFFLTILFGLFATLTRPFGFITILALITNEFAIAKNKKKILLILIPILVLIVLTVAIIFPLTFSNLYEKIINITHPEYFLKGLKALKDQFNSLIIATYLVPVIVFFNCFSEKKPKAFNQIKYYIITFIVLNVLISANHMFDYLLGNSPNDLITRYINMSIVYVYLFTFIHLFRIKKLYISKLGIFSILISIISLAFISYTNIKHSLNLDLSLFYDTAHFNKNNITPSNFFVAYYFFPVCLVLLSLLLFNKRKLIITILIFIALAQSAGLYNWQKNFIDTRQKLDTVYNYFKKTDYNLLFLQNYQNKFMSFSFWNILSLTKNDIHPLYVHLNKTTLKEPDLYTDKAKEILNKYDYIISSIDYSLPKLTMIDDINPVFYPPQGKNLEEHLEILKSQNKPIYQDDTK